MLNLPDFYTSLEGGNKNWHFSFAGLMQEGIPFFL